MTSRRPLRTRSSLQLVAAGAAAAVLAAPLLASPATAQTLPEVSTFAELQAAITEANIAEGADIIPFAAGAEITGGERLIIDGTLTLDLNGGTLTVPSIIASAGELRIADGALVANASGSVGSFPGIGVEPTASLIIDGAVVTASGSECDAGIGGFSDATDSCLTGSTGTPGSITIVDSVVTATGGEGAAAIGGGFQGTLSTLTIISSRVDAQGGPGQLLDGGAGLGGGAGGDGGVVSISDSTVNATAGIGAAGIGGGGQVETGGGFTDSGSGGTVSIDGGSVTAVAGANAAGIGGGVEGDGGTTTITGDAVVTTTGDSFGASIGGGFGGAGGTTSIGGTATVNALHSDTGGGELRGISAGFGGDPATATTTISDGTPTLTTELIAGAFTVAAGAALSIGSTIPLTLQGSSFVLGSMEGTFPGTIEIPTGSSLTNEGRVDGSARLIGEGLLVNEGSICAPIDDEATDPLDPTAGLTVEGNAFYLPYRYPIGFTVGNAVYAPTMQEGCRGFPDVSYLPTGETTPLINVGWTVTEDGSGPFVTETTELATVVPSKTGTFWPTMVAAEVTAVATPSSVSAGETTVITVTGPFPLSNAASIDLTDRATFSDEGQMPGSANGELSFAAAGDKTVTASVDYFVEGESFVASDATAISVSAASLAALRITPSATSVQQGGSVLLEVTGADEFGNAVVIAPDDVTVTSSVPTDVIEGLRVSFPTASPHILTVTVGEVSAQVTIEVVPALAPTGAADVSPLAAIALLALLLGVTAIGTNRIGRSTAG